MPWDAQLASICLQLRVWLHRRRLDTLLAEGRNPARDAKLALRAKQLGRPPARKRLAAQLAEAVDSVDAPAPLRPLPEAPVARAAVIACRSDLAQLAAMLQSKDAPRVRGIAITRELLTDGAGPLYARDQGDRLRNIALTAQRAL